MARIHRWLTSAAVIVCLAGAPLGSVTVSASEEGASSARAGSPQPLNADTLNAPPRLIIDTSRLTLEDASAAFAQRGRYRDRRGHNDAAQAEIIVGTIATITGAALLVYANRPECSTNAAAGGCGYGSKVVGGAVLSGGIVSLIAGAVTWR